ncbi:hypothetical protein AAC387_Pa01g0473 [Persea americana]
MAAISIAVTTYKSADSSTNQPSQNTHLPLQVCNDSAFALIGCVYLGKGQEYWQDERITEETPLCRRVFNSFHPFDQFYFLGKGQEYWQDERITEETPLCRRVYNSFHPFDLVAYRYSLEI